ncbi:MAG: MarR family transcriptional regulator [Desulfobacterales bacterium]|nr:MarR family transcriptional regulator [Desulfobacterales bacterium]
MKPEDCIFFQLAKTSQCATRFWANKINGFNITAAQGMIINFLFVSDLITSSELGKRTMLDSATLTGILDRLETSGIVERKQHPDDRRAILVGLTQKGTEIAGKLIMAAEEANKDFLASLTAQQQTLLKDLLKVLRN